MPFDERFQSLFKLTAKTPISVFTQTMHSGESPKPVNDPKQANKAWQLDQKTYTQIKGGFCVGASLDWLRKVVQSDYRVDMPDYAQRGIAAGTEQNYHKVDHLKQSRVTRMTGVHQQHNAGLKDTFTEAKLNPLHEKHAALTASSNDVIPALSQAKAKLWDDFMAWVVANGGTRKGTTYDFMPSNGQILEMHNEKAEQYQEACKKLKEAADAERAKIHGEIQTAADSLSSLAAAWNSTSNSGKREQIWKEFTGKLDKGLAKKRRFSGTVPVASSGASTFRNLAEFLNDALSSQHFSKGRGMLLEFTFNPPPGHAVALHRDANGIIFLFDPNLGVYMFKEPSLLMRALVVLINLGYLNDRPGSAICGLGTGHTWQIFGRANDVAERKGGILSPEQSVREFEDAIEMIRWADQVRAEIAAEQKVELEAALKAANQLYLRFDGSKTPENQRTWVEAHNEATRVFREISGASLQQAQAAYQRFTGNTITIG